jgi:predicted nucleic acid-binding protein
MIFIYLLEDHPGYAPRLEKIYARMQERRDTLHTSVFTFAENLVGPIRNHEPKKATTLRTFFHSEQVRLIPFTPATAEIYAEIRARHSVSAPDAIHLASAAHAGIDLFLTNDLRLHRLYIPGIQFIAGIDTALL